MPVRPVLLATAVTLLGSLAACRSWTPATRTALYVEADVQVRFTAPRTVTGSTRRDSLALRDVMRLDGTVADRRGDTIWVWVSRAHAAGGARVHVTDGTRARVELDEATIIDVGKADPVKTIGFGALTLAGLWLVYVLAWLATGAADS